MHRLVSSVADCSAHAISAVLVMINVRLCILVGMIQMTLSISNNIPGLDVDNPQKVCDSALNYRGLVIPAGDTRGHYSIETSANEYMPDEAFRVTIKAEDNRKFRGITIQARHHDIVSVGHFKADRELLYTCSDVNDTLVIWYDKDQATATYTWTAPKSRIGSVTFVANVITSDRNLYPNISTKLIRRGFPEINITGCGITKGCFRYPQEGHSTCTHYTCQYLVTYQRKDEVAYFEISAMAGWAAIGFSSDDKMGGDDVFMCVHQSSSGVDVRHYRNELAYQSPTLQQDGALTDPEVDTTSGEGRVSCRFKRLMSAGEPHVDLNNDWYQLYAWGPLSGDHISRHTLSKPPTSSTKITLSPRLNVIGGSSSRDVHSLLLWSAVLVQLLVVGRLEWRTEMV